MLTAERCAARVMRPKPDSVSRGPAQQHFERAADCAADAIADGRAAPRRERPQRSAPGPRTPVDIPGSGSALDAGLRATMERGFDADFSQVRIHADDAAASAARRFQARAFAGGENIVFGRGQYRPWERQGRHLLAHELAHVLQQRDGAPPILRKTGTDPLTYDAPLLHTWFQAGKYR